MSEIELQYNNNDWYNGSIKSITLQNFMSHSNFHLKLNPRINFISGLNGSGKSAIQAAIVVIFGGRASITSRGSSLKSFIKYGCSSTTISITIANDGDETQVIDSFRPDVYGKEITIIRTISESGNNSCKILNEHGKIIKGYVNELKNIILHFSIFVDNPVCVMNQGMVKIFHKSTNSKDKYDIFYRAISADIYNKKIEETKLIANEYSEKLLCSQNVLEQCCKEVHEYETYEKKSKHLETLKKYKCQFENEFAWLLVSKQEESYQEVLQQIKMQKTNMSQSADRINMLEENIKTNSETLLIKKDELTKIDDICKKNHFIYMETKKQLQDKINEYHIMQQTVRKHESALSILYSDEKELKKYIEIERQKGNKNTYAQYKAMLTQYEQTISEVDAAWKTKIEHEQILRNTIDDLKEKIGNLRNNEITPLQRKVSELNRNINSMYQQQDRINFYGNWMPKLIETIDHFFKQNKFIKKPIGPIGTHIKVNNDKWIFSIENHLGRGALRTFLVDNFADNKVLQSIMDKIIPANTRKPTIITSKFFNKVHDVSVKETTNSMFRMLTFTNPVVANCLIDNNRIESIMLVDKTTEAMSLMENLSTVPKCCAFSLTLDGTQVYPSPSYRVYSLQNANEPILLQTDVSVAVSNLKREKEDLEIRINCLSKEFEHFEKSKLEKQQHLNNTKSETNLLKAKYDEYSKKCNDLKAKCDEEQDDKITALTEEMNDVTLKIENIIKLKEDSLKPIEEYDKEMRNINEKLTNIKSIINKNNRTTLYEEITTIETEIDRHKTELLQINNNVAEEKQALNNLIKKAENEAKMCKKAKKNAEMMCDEINVTRSEGDIWRDIESTKHKYNLLEMELKKRGKNHLVLRDEYKKKKEEYLRQSALCKQVENIFNHNNGAVQQSTLALKQYIENVCLKVIESFDLVLMIRHIKGKLEIDQEQQSITITMFNNISTSCASGGERTFATVALILALWNNMQSPFYSIDEYDVYMDNVNRIATTNLLMMAIENRKNQFIFLTPQDISHINSAPYIKIVKLKEPRS